MPHHSDAEKSVNWLGLSRGDTRQPDNSGAQPDIGRSHRRDFAGAWLHGWDIATCAAGQLINKPSDPRLFAAIIFSAWSHCPALVEIS